MEFMDDKDDQPLLEYQARELLALCPDIQIENIGRKEAARLIKLHDPQARWRTEPISKAQAYFLSKYGLWGNCLTKGDASDVITEAKRRNRQEYGYLARLEIETRRRTGGPLRY